MSPGPSGKPRVGADADGVLRPVLSRGTVDRASAHRTDPAWLAAAWRDRGQVLRLDADLAAPVSTGTGSTTDDWLTGDADLGPADGEPVDSRSADGLAGSGRSVGPVAVAARRGPELVFEPADGALPDEALFLGEDARAAYFALVDPAPAESVDPRPPRRAPRPASAAVPGSGPARRGLREVGAALPARDAGLLVHAVALASWHRTHTHCPRCGTETVREAGGSLRRCPKDDSEHYPRTDPAMVVLVTDPAGERAVLGRGARWPPGFFSCLAGFVEAGESVEQAVTREVHEEVGLAVRSMTYVDSQPWPFPQSLMLGFTAVAGDGELVLEEAEVAEAHWFGRDELRAGIADGTVGLPPRVSIARLLIDGWLAAD